MSKTPPAPASPVFYLDNKSLHELTLASAVQSGTQVWPQAVGVGARLRVTMTEPSGSAIYKFGDVCEASVSWSAGPHGPVLSCGSGASRAIVFLFDDATQAVVQASEAQTDAQRLSEGTAAPKPGPNVDLGAVIFYEPIGIRIDNQSDQKLALTSSNVALEAAALGAAAKEITPPPTVDAGAKKDFTAYTWPKAFVNYAFADSDWNSAWVQVWWDAGGPAAKVHSMNAARAFLTARLDRAPSPGPDGDPVFVVTIERGTPQVPVAPIVPTNKDIYQVVLDDNHPLWGYTEGHGHGAQNPVLGVDVSESQSMDYERVSNWVDSQNRRAWFVGARVCLTGRRADHLFKKRWGILSQSRFFRLPYVFLMPLDKNLAAGASDATLQALADAQFDDFKRIYLAAGGWKPYDLPIGLDFEPETPPLQGATSVQLRNAWTLLTVLRTFIRRSTAMFQTAPFLYSGNHFFRDWYPLAKAGMKQEQPGATWDDAWLDPIFSCRIWHSFYPRDASPTSPSPQPQFWPWATPVGFHRPWFTSTAPWHIYQFGIAREHGAAGPLVVSKQGPAQPLGNEVGDPAWNALPPSDAQSFGDRAVAGVNPRLDLDVWNGGLDDFLAMALLTRLDPNA